MTRSVDKIQEAASFPAVQSAEVRKVEEVNPRRKFVRQFSVMLPNRVGAFSSLATLLSHHQIDVIGVSVQDSRDATVARLIVNDPDAAEILFLEKGIAFTISKLVVVRMKEAGRELTKCLATLLEGETNLDFAYSLMVQHQGQALMALHLEDAEFGSRLLNQAGLTVIFENELLR